MPVSGCAHAVGMVFKQKAYLCKMYQKVVLGWLLFFALPALAQDSLPAPSKKRLKTVAWIGGIGYVGTMTGLSLIWYDNLGKFKFFNDNHEWYATDKIGHFYTAYQFSRATEQSLKWAGLSEKKARLWAGITGIAVMAPIEVLDGFSPKYGASWGDLVANTSGAMFLFGQSALWNDTRIQPKFSFFPSGLARYRPNLLGANFPQQIIKDYNGQTYWLSVNVGKFLPKRKFPKWLNLAVGYGIGDMVSAEPLQSKVMGFEPYREYYLGLDFDFQYLKPKKRIARIALYLLGLIRLPAPALAYSPRYGWRGHWLYF